MKEDTPNIGAVCQRLAKYAPSGLSAEQIAYRLGRPYNTLMSELSPLRDTHKFDVNLLIPLMRLAGSTEPLHEMARALGGVYVDFLPVSDAAHPVHGQCMASVKSFGDMMVGTAKALEDNIITSEERRELARLGYSAVGDILALLLQIDEAEARIGAGHKERPGAGNNAEGKHPVRTAQMDRNEIYTGKARLVNRGNGIVLRCATKGELAALLSLLRALFPHGGRMKDLMGRVAA